MRWLWVASFVLIAGVACRGEATTPTASPSRSASVASPSVTPTLACTIEGTRRDDKLTGTPDDDVICGLGGNDIVRGGEGADTLLGGLGDDALAPGPGDNTVDGGLGTDTADYGASGEGITANLRLGTVALADGTHDVLTSIERLIGSPKDDRVTGSDESDTVDGGPGSDTIRLLAGDDVADGGDGDDALLGGDGSDVCIQGPGVGKVQCEGTWTPTVFARVGDVDLFEPAEQPMLIAYHESLFDTAAELDPIGDKKGWLIQGSRGRGTPPTSAVDIPLKPGTTVVSPVTGSVTAVIEYPLYCEALDTLVVIRPSADRKVSVVVMHLVDVSVDKGDDVVGGVTRLGEPHVFPGGTNQVDAYVPGSPPHVHVEVESDGSKVVPGCDFKRTSEGAKR